MKHKKAAVRFRKQFLYEILQDPESGVELQKANQHLALHPTHLNKLQDSLKAILDTKIGRYDDDLNGIILGHDNVKLLQNSGSLSNDSHYIHVDIEVDVFLLKVEIGQVLTGSVNKISDKHVGCLVHNAFNVSLLPPQGDKNWLGYSLMLGQKVVFAVTNTDFEGHIPYIRGELREILEDPYNTSEGSSDQSKSKKKRKRLEE